MSLHPSIKANISQIPTLLSQAQKWSQTNLTTANAQLCLNKTLSFVKSHPKTSIVLCILLVTAIPLYKGYNYVKNIYFYNQLLDKTREVWNQSKYFPEFRYDKNPVNAIDQYQYTNKKHLTENEKKSLKYFKKADWIRPNW
jgi:hypothetical protein